MVEKPMEKVFMLAILFFAAIATIRLESKPPDNKTPTGTSEVNNLFLIDLINKLSVCSKISFSVKLYLMFILSIE